MKTQFRANKITMALNACLLASSLRAQAEDDNLIEEVVATGTRLQGSGNERGQVLLFA